LSGESGTGALIGVFLSVQRLEIRNIAGAYAAVRGSRVSYSRRPHLSYWQSSLMVLVFLIALATPVAVQSKTPEDSAEKTSLLQRAVVIVTTVDREGKQLLQGSGFFIAADRIVTNLHVIKGAAVIRCETFDGKTTTVRNVVAVDELDDLALLQLEVPQADAAVLQLADSVPVEGEAIAVMSSPRGSNWKLTRGQVGPTWQFKGTGQRIQRIQITASIFPGSSGGPVVNQEGDVVGIAVMHFEGNDDLNFAIPARSLKSLQASINITKLR
jgi:S1-C subfamily serine protease